MQDPAKESLTDRAYTILEELIVTLVLPPRTTRTVAKLCEEIKIGRTPIRDALLRLKREGLVEILPRTHILITETTPQEQLRVLEIRREVERLLARTSAERATAAQRRQFSQPAAKILAAAGTGKGLVFVKLDGELNALICEAADNKFAASVMQCLSGHSRRFWFLHHDQTTDLKKTARLHANEARAIAKGDKDRAAAACDMLIDYVEDFARAVAKNKAHAAGK
jgi:DNA-binding GntR family transcriptional regulator